MRFSLKRILLNFYFALQIFTVSMGLLCGFDSYSETDIVQENIPYGVEEVKNSVVKLFLKTNEGIDKGTGFILEDGILVTNFHVLSDGNDSFFNQINSGHLSQIKILQDYHLLDVQVTSIQAVDPVHDLALLNIKGDIPPAIKKHQGELDFTKEQLFLVGYPYGQLKVVDQKGPIQIYEIEDRAIEARIPVSDSDQRGASGGPIVNQKGEVVGICKSISSLGKTVNFSYSEYLFSLQNAEYGVQCSKSISVKDCFKKAKNFLLKEAQKGDIYAQFKLGKEALKGDAYTQFKLEKEVQKEDTYAQFKLRNVYAITKLALYFIKMKIKTKNKEDLKWLKIPAEEENKEIKNFLNELVKNNNYIEDFFYKGDHS
ncbi:MAG: S1 family peptidase [Bdellovibrionales bacterium]